MTLCLVIPLVDYPMTGTDSSIWMPYGLATPLVDDICSDNPLLDDIRSVNSIGR